MKLTKQFRVLYLLALLVVGFSALAARADVRLPAIIGENMVLQRGEACTLWGWADGGEEIRVEFQNQTKTVTADGTGKWSLKLDPLKEGGPYKMRIAGKNELKFDNILVGDVWVCSGQSNMEWPLHLCNDPEKEIAAANYPNIRLITVPKASTNTPQDDFQGSWAACTPESAKPFSGVAYFFGRKLHQELKVPIGLINTSWGGSSCETWINPTVVGQYKDYEPIMQRKAAADAAKPEGGDNQNAGYLYNGMIVPITKYAIKGAIWYQGETNAGRAYQYRTLFPLMIETWREEWGQGDFPFYFVQLANFITDRNREKTGEPRDDSWAELREAQSMTLSLPNTGEAVIIDIGDPNDIHPRNKQDVGLRLALQSLARDYRDPAQRGQGQRGQNRVVSEGPRFQSLKIDGNKAIVAFRFPNAVGLKAKEGEIKGFAIAGADRKFYWAEAKVERNTVVLTSPSVPHPVAVRYGWDDDPVCNLMNGAGLPACPFRTDMWPGVTINNK